MTTPADAEILRLLDRLNEVPAEALESDRLEFKPWRGPKEDMRVAVEYAACLANAEGGAIVFGVKDNALGRVAAIHGVKRYDKDTWEKGIFAAIRPNLRVEVGELEVPDGTGRLLVVRVPKWDAPPYGTADGMFKRRVGKNCMPMDPQGFVRARVASGAIDWSGQPAAGISVAELDPVEIARARSVLRRQAPDSDLLGLDDAAFLRGLGAVREGKVTHAGLLLFGRADILAERCPQNQVHYVHQPTETKVARNDAWRAGLLQMLEKVETIFSGPVNPEEEVSIGLFKLRIPAFPLEVVREAVLNAITHRDYSDPGEVMVRHAVAELVITSPGGFLAGITPGNILRQESVSRNRTLAEAFQKLRLVERAGTGVRRIYIPVLSYGKRAPRYETDGTRVILRIFDGTFDERMARLVAKWRKADGREVDIDSLLVLSHLREHAYIDTREASELLHLTVDQARGALDRLAQPGTGFLERRGRTRTATYHISKGIAKDLLGKAAYTKTKGVDPARYRELVRNHVETYGAITPMECRELLGLGESQSARVEISKHLRRWSSGPDTFLRREGKGRSIRYVSTQGGGPEC